MAPQKTLGSSRLLQLGFAFLICPIGMCFIVAIAPLLREQYDLPTWVFPARIIGLVLIAWALFALIVIPRNFRKKEVAALLRQRGRDPEQDLFIVGSACMLLPAIAGVLLAVAGGRPSESYAYCAVSLIAYPIWWLHKRDIFREAAATETSVRYLKSYTFILSMLGVLHFLGAFLALDLFLRLVSNPSPARAVLLLGALLSLSFGLVCFVVSWLRLRGTLLAGSATTALSWLLLAYVPLGTLASLYWLIRVRKREAANARTTAG